VNIAVESKDTQDKVWNRISRDDYMMYAVQECYYAVKLILTEVLDDAGRIWYVTVAMLKCTVPCCHSMTSFVFDILTCLLSFICNCCCCTRVERIYDDINASIAKRSIPRDFRLNKLAVVISRITALMGILVCI
jgi:callose synthase